MTPTDTVKLRRPEPEPVVEPEPEVEDAFDLFSVLNADEVDLGPVEPETPRAPVVVDAAPVAVEAVPAPEVVVRAQSTVEIVAGARSRSRFRRGSRKSA